MKRTSINLSLIASIPLLACGGTPEAPVVTQELSCSIPTDEIFSAAAGSNAIPALTNPEVAAADAAFMRTTDRVLGITVNGEARAYPFGILWWHEVVNDTLGGQPVLVTYCPLTGSGIAFDPVARGQTREFGVSGLLYLTNLMMFDRQTNSLWNQMSLGAQCGPDRGLDLPRIPILETTWEHWVSRHPNTTVITPNTGFSNRPYFAYPYEGYDDPDNGFVDFLPPGVKWSNELRPKELVLGILQGGDAVAYPLDGLASTAIASVVNDSVGTFPILVTSLSQWSTAQAFDRRVNGQELTFTIREMGPFKMVDDQTNSEWNSIGQATGGTLAGERLEPIVDAFVAFWFAWSIYFPQTTVHR